MNYTNKSFSVSSPGTKQYADNWERVFAKKECSCPEYLLRELEAMKAAGSETTITLYGHECPVHSSAP